MDSAAQACITLAQARAGGPGAPARPPAQQLSARPAALQGRPPGCSELASVGTARAQGYGGGSALLGHAAARPPSMWLRGAAVAPASGARRVCGRSGAAAQRAALGIREGSAEQHSARRQSEMRGRGVGPTRPAGSQAAALHLVATCWATRTHALLRLRWRLRQPPPHAAASLAAALLHELARRAALQFDRCLSSALLPALLPAAAYGRRCLLQCFT